MAKSNRRTAVALAEAVRRTGRGQRSGVSDERLLVSRSSSAAASVTGCSQVKLRHTYAVVRPSIPTYPRVSHQLQTMLESVLLGRCTPAEAAAMTADRVSAITGLPVRPYR